MGLKIQLMEVNGEKRVHPETMAILMEFGDHKKTCAFCAKAMAIGGYCPAGGEILVRLSGRPDVSQYDDDHSGN